jgi:hypothetical protein
VDLAASFTFDEPFRAELGASIIEDLEREASLSGEVALVIEGKWWNPQHIRWRGACPRHLAGGHLSAGGGGGMQHEADHFADCLRHRLLDSPWCPRP